MTYNIQTKLAQVETEIAKLIPTATFTPLPTNTSNPSPTPSATTPIPTSTMPADISIRTIAENAPQTWEGTFDQYDYKEYPMVLHIEQVEGMRFSGKLHWPTLRNSITVMRGEFVESFGDFVEQSKWRYVGDLNSENGGVWMKFTETELIQGSNIVLNGWYYAYAQDNNTMRGVFFSSEEAAEPIGDFTIFLNNP